MKTVGTALAAVRIFYQICLVLSPHLRGGWHFFIEKMTGGVFTKFDEIYFNSFSLAPLDSSLKEGAELLGKFHIY